MMPLPQSLKKSALRGHQAHRKSGDDERSFSTQKKKSLMGISIFLKNLIKKTYLHAYSIPTTKQNMYAHTNTLLCHHDMHDILSNIKGNNCSTRYIYFYLKLPRAVIVVYFNGNLFCFFTSFIFIH